MKRLKRIPESGQALVEFALIIIVLLTLSFFVVEASRILWAWGMAQNAARTGARYAVTGNYAQTEPCLADPTPCGTDVARVNTIRNLAQDQLDGLPISEDLDAGLEDDNYLLIEVYGVQCFTDNCSVRDYVRDFAGEPGQPVLVRVIYNVPMVTPILSGIVSNVRVVGQVIEQNELYGQLGGITSGASLPPQPPPPPTAGASPTFTPTPTPTTTATSTPGPSPTNTDTPTPTATATADICPIAYVNPSTDLIDGNNRVRVTGDFNTFNIPGNPPHTVNIVDLTDNVTLASGLNMSYVGPGGIVDCQGFADITLSGGIVFQEGHTIIATSSDGTSAAFVVQPNVDTPTPSSTPTAQPTFTPSPTLTPTDIPVDPFIAVIPECVVGPTINMTLQGGNWPTATTINLFWNGTFIQPISTASGFFTQNWNFSNVANGFYTIKAETAGGDVDTTILEVDDNCGFVTPPPDTPTPTPNPADLVIVGLPVPINITRPLTEYTPVAFQVVITNTGEVQIDSQFFVDIYLDPESDDLDLPDTISINASSGYMAVSSLGPLSSRTITVTADLGFTGGFAGTREVYGMVDSLHQIPEMAPGAEENNISGPLNVEDVTPIPTPTSTATPTGFDTVSGIVRILLGTWVPQHRAVVQLQLVDAGSGIGTVVQQVETDTNGFYAFNGVDAPFGGDYYEVVACIAVDGTDVYTGFRTAVIPPNPFVDVFMLLESGVSTCPLP